MLSGSYGLSSTSEPKQNITPCSSCEIQSPLYRLCNQIINICSSALSFLWDTVSIFVSFLSSMLITNSKCDVSTQTDLQEITVNPVETYLPYVNVATMQKCQKHIELLLQHESPSPSNTSLEQQKYRSFVLSFVPSLSNLSTESMPAISASPQPFVAISTSVILANDMSNKSREYSHNLLLLTFVQRLSDIFVSSNELLLAKQKAILDISDDLEISQHNANTALIPAIHQSDPVYMDISGFCHLVHIVSPILNSQEQRNDMSLCIEIIQNVIQKTHSRLLQIQSFCIQNNRDAIYRSLINDRAFNDIHELQQQTSRIHDDGDLYIESTINQCIRNGYKSLISYTQNHDEKDHTQYVCSLYILISTLYQKNPQMTTDQIHQYICQKWQEEVLKIKICILSMDGKRPKSQATTQDKQNFLDIGPISECNTIGWPKQAIQAAISLHYKK